jgi:hypothetical protein
VLPGNIAKHDEAEAMAKRNEAIAKHNAAIERCRRDTIARLTAEANEANERTAPHQYTREEFGRIFAGMPVDAFMKLFGPLLTPEAMMARHKIEEEARRKAEQQIADASRDICDHLINGR